MVAIINTWHANSLAFLFRAAELPDIKRTRRRVFSQAAIMDWYSQPYHCVYEFDELGQWADDGGR